MADDDALFQKGMPIRREVLGLEYVDASMARADVTASRSPARRRVTQPRMAVRGVRKAWAAIDSSSSRARQAPSASASAFARAATCSDVSTSSEAAAVTLSLSISCRLATRLRGQGRDP